MSDKKKKIDLHSPEAHKIAQEIYERTYTTEGMMVAFPACFPGATIPIVADEGHITALDVTSNGSIYGGTSGKATHLFTGLFHGTTGVIFDLGTVAGGEQCAAICCGEKRFIAGVNGPRGGRLLSGEIQHEGYDLIQEWGFQRSPFQELGGINDEPIVHAVADLPHNLVVGITSKHLFTVDLTSSKIEVVGEVSGAGRIATASGGSIIGADGAGHLWSFEVGSRSLRRKSIALPAGTWDPSLMVWTRSRQNSLLYTADSKGNLFSFDETKGFSSVLGKAPLTPVSAMAVTLDGRVFGFCGLEMAKMFSYSPARREISNLGVAVSVIERRRYGYVFSDTVVGRDGEIYFGEDDNLGHLWLYFPKIEPNVA